MKFLRRSLFAMASVAMLTACSSDDLLVDEPNNGGGNNSEGSAVYMGLTVQMPGAGSRSTTQAGGGTAEGTEVGKDYENNVSDVAVVLANPTNNSFITWGQIDNPQVNLVAIPANNSYKTTVKVDFTQIYNYYNENSGRTANVFVFCNPTKAMLDYLKEAELNNTEWFEQVTENIDEEASAIAFIGDKNNASKSRFVMSNFAIALRQLPKNADDWNQYKTASTAFDLSGLNNAGTNGEIDNSLNNSRGPVRVERMAARFDFKDGSPEETPANTYNVVKSAEGKAIINIELVRMALLNTSKSMYNLRRVSSNGQNTNSTLCGLEIGGSAANYVVGPNAQAFISATDNDFGLNAATGQTTFKFSEYFNQPLFDDNGRINSFSGYHQALLNDVIGSEENDNYGNQEYKIWHYTTENVIPGMPVRQENGISTGVVFKGKILATEELKNVNEPLYNKLTDGSLTGNPEKDPILYSFNSNLYLAWEEVFKAAIDASVEMVDGVPVVDEEGYVKSVNRSNSLYVAVFGTGGIGEFTWGTTTYKDRMAVDASSTDMAWNKWNTDKTTESLMELRKTATGANFTLYQSSNDSDEGPGYYCNYYYWNRHNDNNQPGAMGPMEFAVVRNNVYKLSVTGIHQLGHPSIPENDPDSPTPDTPDESDDIYITVTCRVLPWVVRVNNIEF